MFSRMGRGWRRDDRWRPCDAAFPFDRMSNEDEQPTRILPSSQAQKTHVVSAKTEIVARALRGGCRGCAQEPPAAPANVAATLSAATPTNAASAAAPVTAPHRAVAVAAPPPGPFDPERELERVAAAQSPDYKTEAAPDRPQLRINKDKLTFKGKTENEGRLYVPMHGTDRAIIQLFPYDEAKNNLIRADSTLSLPSGKGNWDIGIGGPPGTDHFIAIVSKYPRDFSSDSKCAKASGRRRPTPRAKCPRRREAGPRSSRGGRSARRLAPTTTVRLCSP
jgi:hypothetical protein